ncbi:unnamed protein product [Prorocentrum cordatum]|nr:unnamed protein product [Polarella glacialis]
MRCLGAVVVALAPVASGQPVQTVRTSSWSFSNLRGLAFARSSSSSSVSWGLGADGQMHKEVHRQEDKMYQDRSVQKEMHSELNCLDGHCHNQVLQGYQPAGPGRLQRVLDLMGVRRAPVQTATVLVLSPPPAVALRGAGAEDPRPPPTLRQALRQGMARPRTGAVDCAEVALLFAGSSLLAIVVSVLGKHLGQRSQARELAEPLAASAAPAPSVAPAASKPQRAGAWLTCEEDAAPSLSCEEHSDEAVARGVAKAYLSRVYAETTMPTKAYLMRVYARALA